MGSPIDAYPPTCTNGGPSATSSDGAYVKPRLAGVVWFTASLNRYLLRISEKRATPTSIGENVCVSCATKFCTRWFSAYPSHPISCANLTHLADPLAAQDSGRRKPACAWLCFAARAPACLVLNIEAPVP